MVEDKKHRSPSGDREPFDGFSKESEESLIQKLKERLKAEQENRAETKESTYEKEAPIEKEAARNGEAPTEKEAGSDGETPRDQMSENARRLAARRRAIRQHAEDEEQLHLEHSNRTEGQNATDDETGKAKKAKRPRRRLSKKAKIWILAGFLLFIISFAVTGFVLHLPNPERDVPRGVVQAIFSTKYMEAAELWGPLLSEDSKRRSMNKLNARIRPYVSKACYKKLESIGLIGTVHKLAYESECNMVFTAFEPISGDHFLSQAKGSETSLNPDTITKAFRVVIDRIDVVNKVPKQTYTFVVIVAMRYQEKELIIEDISFDDESKLPVETKTNR